METQPIGALFDFLPKSKIPASAGVEKGRYPFYTSSPILSRRTDQPLFSTESLVFGTGGQASVHYDTGPFATSSECLVAVPRPDSPILTRFIYYYLVENISLLERGFRGAALKHIKKSYIAEIPVPVIPLWDQENIVAVLDRIRELGSQREATISLLDELCRSLFLDRFGDPGKMPDRYPHCQLGTFARISGGENLPSLGGSRTNTSQPAMLKQDAVTKRHYDPAQNKAMELTACIRQREVRPDDLLLSRKNTSELVGAAAFVFDTPPNLHLPDTLLRIEYSQTISGVYLYYLFNDMNFRRIFGKIAGGTMSAMQNIPISKLSRLEIPCQPLSEQQAFENQMRAVHRWRTELEADQQTLQELLRTVSRKLFDGSLSFDPSLEFETLIGAVRTDLRLNDLSKFSERRELLRRLIDAMNDPQHAFPKAEQYEKAAKATMQLLYEGILFQEYDEEHKRMKLRIR